MWFKQAQLFKFEEKISFNIVELEEYLKQLSFTPCPSGLPISQGWVSPTDIENDPLVYVTKEFMLICLQSEAKLLPAKILRQKLNEKIKKIQLAQDRKISYKEKNIIKQEVYNELLPKAFGVIYRDYAIIDTKNNWLILNTNSAKNTENFVSFFNRSTKIKIVSMETKKLSPILTDWLLNETQPNSLNIEDACVLRDPEKGERVIRIQKQDLLANYVQSLIKNNFEISQMKVSWNSQVTFVLKNDFTLQSLQYNDALVEPDEERDDEGSFKADFFIMSSLLVKIFQELSKIAISVT